MAPQELERVADCSLESEGSAAKAGLAGKTARRARTARRSLLFIKPQVFAAVVNESGDAVDFDLAFGEVFNSLENSLDFFGFFELGDGGEVVLSGAKFFKEGFEGGFGGVDIKGSEVGLDELAVGSFFGEDFVDEFEVEMFLVGFGFALVK